jgi:mannose-1-phosphate guanylyltransferase
MFGLLIAGGFGTRLWPVSRRDNPKQLQNFIGQNSLIAQSFKRFSRIVEPTKIHIVTGKSYVSRIIESVPEISHEQIIAEPFPIGTNLAVGLGAFRIYRENPNAQVLIGWADSYIGNERELRRAVSAAQKIINDYDGVMLGGQPTRAATEYGYIECGTSIAGNKNCYRIAGFKEKPNPDRADEFLKSNRYLWNTGISLWKVANLLKLMRTHTPAHYAAIEYVYDSQSLTERSQRMKAAFKCLAPLSIDNALYEKAANLAVVAAQMKWSDVGNWSAIYDVQTEKDKNVTKGAIVSVDTEKCLIYSHQKLVATLGISDLIIVETADAVLVVHKSQTARLKELYAQIKELNGNKYL